MLFSMAMHSFAISPTTDNIVAKAKEIIISSEGTYKSVNPDDNGALSIGCIQWHGNRALNLLKDIVAADTATALNLLGQVLYNEVVSSTSWSTRTLNSDEASRISALIDTAIGRAKQDQLVSDNILYYVNHGKNLGITSPSALVYFADIENQCGSGGSARIAKAAAALAGNREITLAILHQAALADAAAGKYPSRRNKVYNYALLLGWEDNISAERYEVWTTNYVLNIRTGPGTSYSKIASYPAGTSVIVYEQTYVESARWGRTSAGWICLDYDYCTFVRSCEPDPNAFRITFDGNGGELGTQPKFTAALDAVNGIRMAGYLVLYTPEFGQTTETNIYGADVVVGADGIVQNNPVDGEGNKVIPSGGFVLSGNDEGLVKLMVNIKAGDYVIYKAADKTIEVYDSYNSYIASNKLGAYNVTIGTLPSVSRPGHVFEGWYCENGVKFEENTVVPYSAAFKLVARWSAIKAEIMFNYNMGEDAPPAATITASGVNIYRNSNMLVVYDNNRGETTGANKWGSEAAVNSAGVVTDVWPASGSGTGNHTIPQGGFVLSGHESMSNWILSNISVGDRVTFDYNTLLVSVYKDGIVTTDSIIASYGSALGALPQPEREGYIFAGWYTPNGTLVTSETVSNFTESLILEAKWEVYIPIIAGDVDGNGTLNSFDLINLIKEVKSTGSTGYTNIDVNGDGKISAFDIIVMVRIIKGLN